MKESTARERLVQAATAFLADTPLAADVYEYQLLDRFIRDELTIHQVLDILAQREAEARSPAIRTDNL
jgi:hypothetical protein